MRYKALAVATAAVSTLAFASTPANAAEGWKTVSTNSEWACTSYKHHPVSDYVNFKVCVVLNENNDAQTVLVVQNVATVAVAIGGQVKSQFSTVTCADSPLNPGFTRGCYGKTDHYAAGGYAVGNAMLKLNTVNAWYDDDWPVLVST
ncbi:hypothetical protein G9272_11985 [Streptomyces asoensis]|uniref:Secreted protein n=1 Tax=Streptomyces asoensis TaxID=249586 RepID=A0A6M4WLE8_9ACTN|nr:hypothetical protein [Streptomyces asoensis]QJT00938.1 hypothetical protein G9272_11985 [Streptomyces asoensis]